MPSYSNGYIPDDLLVTFRVGYNSTDGSWAHSLSPATYARHLALVGRAKDRTGRTLTISDGWGAYRPYPAQVVARNVYGNGAAWPGTSSHGGFWEGRQTLAMDYSNWSWVYGGDWEAFKSDCYAVGLTPGMISEARGYPEEKWHVIDLDPWGAVPAGFDATNFLEDDMFSDSDRTALAEVRRALGAAGFMDTFPSDQAQADASVLAHVRAAVTGINSLQRYIAFGGEDVKNGIGATESIFGLVLSQKAQISGLTAAVGALATGAGMDPAELEALIDRAVKGAFDGVIIDNPDLNPQVIAKAVNDDADQRERERLGL